MVSQKRFATLLVAFSIFFSTGWFINHSLANDNEEVYARIDRGLLYLKEVFETVSRNYVDDLDAEALSKSAIEGMLKDFDPYTVFFEDPGSHQMRMITRGKYGGVGMEISAQNNHITVIAPMEGTPAQRAGVRAGDIITKIDGIPTTNLKLPEASQKLRGKIGTKVVIEIERPGLPEPFSVELVREEIVIRDVTYADFLEPGTAYIRLSAFSDKAGDELREAIRELETQMPLERLILDLRGNPGGLLTAAVEVANVFLPPGQLVVSTRGSHERENKFFTKENPLLSHQPLVVLVNESSASASEIVAGAIQDLDRGVLVGMETFGKGLVQKVYPIDRHSQAYLKITTAKYYVPSGRSIQKEDYKKNARVFIDFSDSVEYDQRVNYYTQNKRVVHGGGGIHPDIEIPEEESNNFLQNLHARALFFQFTVDYLSRHPELKNAADVAVDEAVLQKFKAYVEESKFDFNLEGESKLEEFIEVSKEKGYSNDIQDLAIVALQKLNATKETLYSKYRKEISGTLEAEFVEKLGGSTARIRKTLGDDRQVQTALQVLRDLPQYQEILAINQ